MRSFGIIISASGRGEAKVTGFKPSLGENVKKYLKTEADFVAAKETPISQWTTDDKLKEVIKRAASLLPESIGNQLLALLDPLSLAIMVGVVIIWAGSHFLVAGWVVDGVMLFLGVVTMGPIAWTAGRHLGTFTLKTINAANEEDLDEAAKHLSEAVALLGVQVVMALLLKKGPKVLNEPRRLMSETVEPLNFKTIGDPPTSSKSFFDGYEGKLSFSKHPFAGIEGEMAGGSTSPYGDISITYSRNAKINDITVAFFHERVHRFLVPRLQLFTYLRQTLTILKRNSYLQSYILRYLEEALAETVGQVKGNGWRNFFVGIKFPTNKGYVELSKVGIEAGGIFLGPINFGGMNYNVYFYFFEGGK